MKTKLHLIILCLVLLFMAGEQSVCLAADTWSYPTEKPKTPFGGGTGSQSDPYLISTAQHLANLAYMVTDDNTEYKNKYFVLTNDITLNDLVINDDGTGLKYDESNYTLWTPIGEYGTLADDDFMGIFDGQGHTIRGMVCISDDGERDYLGLFGTADQATIMNLNIEDSYLCTKKTSSDNQAYGMLIGESTNTTLINCHVSNSVVNVTHTCAGSFLFSNVTYRCYVGGLIGICDESKGFLDSRFTDMSNCSFSGKIYANGSGEWCSLFVGGLLGCQSTYAISKLNLTNCNTEGDIYIKAEATFRFLQAGGIAMQEFGNDDSSTGDSEIQKCVNRMNITVVSGEQTINNCYLSGFGCLKPEQKVSQCVNLGTIKVGSAGNKAKISNLYLDGLFLNQGFLSGCASYGKFDIHSEGEYACISPLAVSLYEIDNIPSVVCSEGNVFDIDYKKNDLDQVSVNTYALDKDNKSIATKHKCYYHFEYTPSSISFPCNGTADASKYNKTLEEMKTGDFITMLNQASGGIVWGKLTGMSDASLNGLPMPVACGGNPFEYNGEGTQDKPYIINRENDLDKLKEYVNAGNDFKDTYFILGSDIYMTGVMDYSIGSYKDKPFRGHFDGYGHAIVGLRNKLFGYMYGTVKNLALVNSNINSQGYTGAIAQCVGDEDNKAEVSYCYVSGVVQASGNSQTLLGGICGNVAKGSAVHDCYFKGHLIDGANYFGAGSSFVGGISGGNDNSEVLTTNRQGIYNCYASFTYLKNTYINSSFLYGICYRGVQDCYFVTNSASWSMNADSPKLDSESELNEKFANKDGWRQGLYRPVLTGVKTYKVTLPDGGTSYIDAVADQTPKQNYIVNVNIGNYPYADKVVWQLPNTAVYVPELRTDYILNCTLNQSAELKYKRTNGAIATKGQLHFVLTQNNKGAHFVCLPGEVLKSDLPEGSDAMIVGKVTVVNDEEQVNVVHVDTIPAGVPCFLYVPVTSVKSGNNIDMLMRSGIVNKPVMNADYSSFKGTFSPQTVSEQACLDVAKETFTRAATRGAAQVEDAYYFIRGNEQAEVKPFSAWIESSLGNVRIVDYLLLDEYSQTNEELIENSTDDVNIKLRLTMDADKWTTVCLPFDMGADEIKDKFGEDTKLEEIESISYDGTTLYIKLKEATDGIVNGYPYFIKPSASNSIFDLGPRILSNELSEDGYMAISPDATRELSLKMGGMYGMSMLSSTEDYNAYYFTDGTLIQVPFGTPFTLGGFRCWFKASDVTTSAPAELSSVIITHSDGTITDISVVAKDPQATKQPIYDLNGIEKKTEKGIYIKGGKVRIKN